MNEKISEQITKNQHIVPERHLKNFVIPNNSRLECFNIDELRLERAQLPKSICRANFHYALEPGECDEYSQIVEKAFGDIEDWYGKNIDRIEKQLVSKRKLSDKDKYAVSWVIANFFFRGHHFRKETKKMLKEVLEWLCSPISEHIHKKCLEDSPHIFSGDEEEKGLMREITKLTLSSQAENTSYATNRAFDEGFANTLTHKKWLVLLNNSEEYPFVTGDEAVIEIVPDWVLKHNIPQSFLILTQIFHLSPRVSIITSYPFNEEMHGQVSFEDISNSKAEISKSNLFYVNHAYKYAYAPNKRFFEDVITWEKKIVRKT